ncbi:hypothetical protein ACLMJK_002268 [Lecanora helva]
MSARASTVEVSKSVRKEPGSPPAHHVGSPPTSFINPWPSFHQHSPFQLFKSYASNRDFKPVPSRDKLVSIQKPDWGAGKHGLKATWIGHASFLIETPTAEGSERGVRILCDPVFSERTSPVSFAGPKRYTPTPCSLNELPDIDIVIISHDHYDHMDSDTLLKVHKRRNGDVHFLVGLGNASRLKSFGIDETLVTQLDWWEEACLDIKSVSSVAITCTPSQHFSGRGVMDHGSTLWCSWVIQAISSTPSQANDKPAHSPKVFFAGDTGYRYVPKDAEEEGMPCCPAFREIGETLGPFDLSLLPIGLYSPRHLLSPVHCSPEDAVCLHKDLRSRKSIGMHYGAVRGGISQYFEEVTEPPRRFQEACQKEGKVWGNELGLISIGETLVL